MVLLLFAESVEIERAVLISVSTRWAGILILRISGKSRRLHDPFLSGSEQAGIQSLFRFLASLNSFFLSYDAWAVFCALSLSFSRDLSQGYGSRADL